MDLLPELREERGKHEQDWVESSKKDGPTRVAAWCKCEQRLSCPTARALDVAIAGVELATSLKPAPCLSALLGEYPDGGCGCATCQAHASCEAMEAAWEKGR